MYKLYVTRGSGNCFKPFLTLSQLEIPFQVVEVNVLEGETRSPEFLSLNSAGSVPYLVTGEGQGVGESNAMLWLIADGTDLMPRSPLERAQSLQWMFFEQSKLEPMISPARFLGHIVPERGVGREAEIASWRQRAATGLATLDAHLADRHFMLGDHYGITDIAVFGYVHVSDEASIDMDRFPAVKAWMARVESTPGFKPLSTLCDGAIAFSARGDTG
ncbi:glutathione S-transferase family protein [Rhizobium sp. FY34]|uniref:glutathione S-transferase family protein n=1 Tax=Rhizobium sp. FY34 TaxID=2562309 RepID=UPI0010C0EE23|nr:glutathione S-transferase family protein [Rhizobium sp. FY34]